MAEGGDFQVKILTIVLKKHDFIEKLKKIHISFKILIHWYIHIPQKYQWF